MKKTAICTISSHNYMAYGLTCLMSAKAFNPCCDYFYLVADAYTEELYDDYKDNIRFVHLNEIGIPDKALLNMAFKYNIVEFNTSVKPKFFSFLFSKGYDTVIYLDPDIECYSSFDDMLCETEDKSIIVTPHKTTAINSKYIDDTAFLNCGIYNLGFIAMNKCAQTDLFLDWWDGKLRDQCFLDFAHGMATDQIWVELASTIFEGFYVLKNPGANVAFWNIHERSLKCNAGKYTINDVPLLFFHFSSLSLKCSDDFLNQLEADNPGFKEFYFRHAEKVRGNKPECFSNVPYSYSVYSDGSKITQDERWLFGFSDFLQKRFENPFDASKNGYENFISSRKCMKYLRASSGFDKLLLIMIKIFGCKNVNKMVGKVYISFVQHISKMFQEG